MNQTLIALKKPSHMKLKLFLLLLLLNVNLFAQNGLGKFSVKWGPQLKGTNSGSISDLIGMDDDFYYFGARLNWIKILITLSTLFLKKRTEKRKKDLVCLKESISQIAYMFSKLILIRTRKQLHYWLRKSIRKR